MRKLSSTFVAILGGLAALLASACDGKGASTSDGSGTGGTGGDSSFLPITLAPSATGVVDDVRSGVMGAWYAYGDSVGSGANAASTDFADSDCAKGGYTMSQCSQITTPTPGQPFPPDVRGAMCTQGIAAKVLMSTTGTTADYSAIWGAGIALDFHNPGGDAGAAKGYFDMTPYVGIGFDFTGTAIPPDRMLVSFPFNGENSYLGPYFWDGATMPSSPLTNGAHVEIQWADVAPENSLVGGIPPPPPFDKTQVASIQFLVFTNTATSTPYQFCVNNLTLLTAL